MGTTCSCAHAEQGPDGMVVDSTGKKRQPPDRSRSWAQRTASHDMSADAIAAAGLVERPALPPKTLSFGGAPPPGASPPPLDRTVSESRRPAVIAHVEPPDSPALADFDEEDGAEEAEAQQVAGRANDGSAAPQHAVVI
eukprot:SAG22_NODE_4534_length_1241_cov_1.676007_1_plen_138_part_01